MEEGDYVFIHRHTCRRAPPRLYYVNTAVIRTLYTVLNYVFSSSAVLTRFLRPGVFPFSTMLIATSGPQNPGD